jgi:glycosyltransferase involved in cell wall biosynthesis
MEEPLVSIVTPAYEADRFIEATLRSVRDQTYEHVEHVVMDGGSSDRTTEILADYEGEEGYDLRWYSEPDEGMYDAIERGFERASGDVLAWLNADDMYLPWAVQVAVEGLAEPGVEWVIGHPAEWDAEGTLVEVHAVRPHYPRAWIERGWYHGKAFGWLQQESMFWTADLWERRGGFPEGVELAGDYYLWRRFAAETGPVQLGTVVAGFRVHDDQFTAEIDDYHAEVPDPSPVARALDALRADELYSLFRTLLDVRTRTEAGTAGRRGE